MGIQLSITYCISISARSYPFPGGSRLIMCYMCVFEEDCNNFKADSKDVIQMQCDTFYGSCKVSPTLIDCIEMYN